MKYNPNIQNIHNEDLITLIIEITRDQYGLQEPEYEQYLDKIQKDKFIDINSPHFTKLINDFTKLLPNLMDTIDEICMYNSNLVIGDLMLNGQIDSGNLDLEENKEEN